jgi:hypothetical protein
VLDADVRLASRLATGTYPVVAGGDARRPSRRVSNLLVVRTKAEKRIAHWMVSFGNWVRNSARADPSRDLYFSGVVMAMNVAQRKAGPPDKTRLSDEQAFGYSDGIALINKVVALGDAPEGEFADLLAAPYAEELAPKRS